MNELALETERLIIFLPSIKDTKNVNEYHIKNRGFYQNSTPKRSDEYYSEKNTLERIEKIQDEFENKSALQLYFRLKTPSKEIAGYVSITQILRGPFQAAYLGYALDLTHTGQGYMNEALGAVIQYSFAELKLHRLMANYCPENKNSERVLEKLGFVHEGLAKDYLFLNGKWRDHILTSLINKQNGNSYSIKALQNL